MTYIGLFNITYGMKTDLIGEAFEQDFFTMSVSGKYLICVVTSDGKTVFLTKDEVDIEIMSYE